MNLENRIDSKAGQEITVQQGGKNRLRWQNNSQPIICQKYYNDHKQKRRMSQTQMSQTKKNVTNQEGRFPTTRTTATSKNNHDQQG